MLNIKTEIARVVHCLAPLALVAALILGLVGCAPTGAEPPTSPPASTPAPVSTTSPAPTPDPTDLLTDADLYEVDKLTVAIPRDVADQVLVFTDPASGMVGENHLLSVYEKQSYEAGKNQGIDAGFLFSIQRLDQEMYERLLANGDAGDVFAREKDCYYAWRTPSDVQYCAADGGEIDTEDAGWKEWRRVDEGVEAARADFIARNDLEPLDVGALYAQDFTWEGEHHYVNYHNADWSTSVTLLLSQPATQGEGGVWCVERYKDNNVAVLYWELVFPTGQNMPARAYYQQMQADADAGFWETHLTPEGAARNWVEDSYPPSALSDGVLTLLEGEPGGNVFGRIWEVMGQEGTLASLTYGHGVETGQQIYGEPAYDQSEGQNLSLPMVAGASLSPMVWIKADAPAERNGRAVTYTATTGQQLIFLEDDLLGVEREGNWEWFASAYPYARSTYQLMQSICEDWAIQEKD